MYKKLLLVVGMLIMSEKVSALGIDNIFLVSGQSDNGDYYNLENKSISPVYVRTEVSEVHIVNNTPTETLYKKDNLAKWRIAVNPALFILDPGLSKKVAVDVLNPSRTLDNDELYSIAFVPEASQDGKKNAQNKMNLQIGVRAYYVIPASKSEMKYKLDYDKKSGKLTVENAGNTFAVVELNHCDARKPVAEKDNSCSGTYLVVAGRKRVFDIPTKLRQDKMNFTVFNHNRSYKQVVAF